MEQDMERTMARLVRLQVAEAHLRAALTGTAGMPTAERAVKSALRIVARQAGKALVRAKQLERESEMMATSIKEANDLLHAADDAAGSA
jgi:hypothetical protein